MEAETKRDKQRSEKSHLRGDYPHRRKHPRVDFR